MVLKICVDAAMTACLLLLMAYELIGKAAHEWIGMGMLVLLVLHHILNRKWSGNILKGRYTALRIIQTALVAAILFCMFGSMASGIVLPEAVFAFLKIREGQSWARTVHMLSSYWGFVLMSLHLGFHWGMMLQMAKKQLGPALRRRTWLARLAAAAIAAYGIFAFVRRELGSYLFLRNEFAFFDFDEPLLLFFLDYAAITGSFVFVGHYLTAFLRQRSRRRRTK